MTREQLGRMRTFRQEMDGPNEPPERARAMAEKISAAMDAVGGGGAPGDRVGVGATRIAEIEENMRARRRLHLRDMIALASGIDQMNPAEQAIESALAWEYYMLGKPVNAIAKERYYSYRHMQRVKRNAVEILCKGVL